MTEEQKDMVRKMSEEGKTKGFLLKHFGEEAAEILDGIRGNDRLLPAWHHMNIAFLTLCNEVRKYHDLMENASVLSCVMETLLRTGADFDKAEYAKLFREMCSTLTDEVLYGKPFTYGDGELLGRLMKVYFTAEKKGGDDGGK